MKSSSRHTANRKRPPRSFVRERKWGTWGCYRGSSMRQLFTFRRSLRFIALALCSASIVVSVTPASARPHHGAGRHARAYHAGHHAKHHYARRHYRHAAPDVALGARRRADAGRRLCRHQRKLLSERGADPNATLTPPGGAMASAGFGSSSNVVAEARRHLGGNPTGRGRLWCARFVNMVLQHSGHRGTGSDMASSFAKYGQRVSGPQVGAIAVMTPRPPRRSCRRHHRHRRQGQSDHDLGQ